MPHRPSEKVLLVGDEPHVLAGLRRGLSDRFNILIAESGKEACRLLKIGDAIGAIVADIRTPDGDGLAFLAEVSERWPHIRRLMLTGISDRETAIAEVNCGRVFRFFRKPCDTDQLADALDEALDEFRFLTNKNANRRSLEIKAKAGMRVRKTFLPMMGHELLTPLNHVLGFSTLLEMKLRKTDEKEALEYLNYIRDSSEGLLRMVQRVLEIVRLSSDELECERHEVNVNAVIGEEVDKFRPKAAARDISLSFQRSPKPVVAFANERQLHFVLCELLDNAIKFNSSGGHVTIAVGGEDDQLTIRIADTGAGMSEASIERAIGMFSHEDDIANPSVEGMGFGLAFAAFFARAYSGRLSIETEKDSGTAIMLTIPCDQQRQQIAQSA